MSNLGTLKTQWLSPNCPQKFLKVCWSTVLFDHVGSFNHTLGVFSPKIEQVLKKNHELFCPVTSALIRAGVALLQEYHTYYIACKAKRK